MCDIGVMGQVCGVDGAVWCIVRGVEWVCDECNGVRIMCYAVMYGECVVSSESYDGVWTVMGGVVCGCGGVVFVGCIVNVWCAQKWKFDFVECMC